jgi:hypothetical protein
MEQATIQQVVFQMLADKMCVRLKELVPEKSVNYDIGMDGDDAVEFFEEFAQRFHVDLTPLGEEWDQYFVPEGVDLGWDNGEIVTVFTASPPRKYHKTVPLLLSRIVEAAEKGHWTKIKDDN